MIADSQAKNAILDIKYKSMKEQCMCVSWCVCMYMSLDEERSPVCMCVYMQIEI